MSFVTLHIQYGMEIMLSQWVKEGAQFCTCDACCMG